MKRIGYWASILSLLFALGYCIPQILDEMGMIPHPQDLYFLFAPSLFLAPSFLVTMICLHYSVDDEQRIWTALGLAFALLYALCVSIVYFTGLTVVIPKLLRGEIDETHVLAFTRKSFLMAVDCLGYFFMSLSTFFAAFAFAKEGKEKWLYRSLLFNGMLMPILVLAFFFPVWYYAGAAWMITFPFAMIRTAIRFTGSSASFKPQKNIYENKQGMASTASHA